MKDVDVRMLSQLEDSPIPDRPGLYAWYFVPRYGRPEVSGTSAAVSEAFVSVSQRYINKLRLPKLDCRVASGTLLGWRGHLTWRQDAPSQSITDPNSLMAAGFGTESQRLAAQEAFANWAVWLMAPIYVGKAKSLRTRLRTHKRIFDRLVRSGPTGLGSASNEDEVDAAHLSGRLVEREIRDSNQLLVALFPIENLSPSGTMNESELEKLALALEYMVNHVTRPILGRR
jgi:hypothetical protein